MLERLERSDISEIHDIVNLQTHTVVVRCGLLLPPRRDALRAPRRRHRVL